MRGVQKNLDLFFRFMYDRHLIWYKRFVLKEPPPWTNNKILRDNKFTNIYRELDRGTLWYISHVYPQAYECWKENLTEAEKSLLYHTVVYRLVNRIETFEKAGFPIVDKKRTNGIQDWFKVLTQLMRQGVSIFTSAHRTCPTHKPGETRLDVLKESVEHTYKNLDSIWQQVKQAQNLETVFNIFCEIPNVGPFISYEICCDLMLVKLIPAEWEDSWVNPGPGCKAGLRLIFPDLKGTRPYQEKIFWLRDRQRYIFKSLKLDFPYFHKDRDLTLRSIEHSLCEFQKYYRCLKGGRTRVNFKPRDLTTSQGQMVLRFVREKNDA